MRTIIPQLFVMLVQYLFIATIIKRTSELRLKRWKNKTK
jgi:hypothetical protein